MCCAGLFPAPDHRDRRRIHRCDQSQVEPYLEHGVEYVYQENSGPGPARNEGIRRARGEVVAFLDADDRWLPEKVSMQMAHLRAHPDLGLVGSAGFDCDSANRPTGVRAAPAIDAEMAFERLLVRNFVQPSGAIVPKRCLDHVGGFKNMRFGEDWDLWLRIAQHYPIGFVQKPLFMRREHPGNLSLEIGDRLLASYQEIAASHLRGTGADVDATRDQAPPSCYGTFLRGRPGMNVSRRQVTRHSLDLALARPVLVPPRKGRPPVARRACRTAGFAGSAGCAGALPANCRSGCSRPATTPRPQRRRDRRRRTRERRNRGRCGKKRRSVARYTTAPVGIPSASARGGETACPSG